VQFTTRKLNQFLLLKLPSAFITGVRVEHITENRAVVKVKHRWISQNPFNSIYFAVQAMAAELSTGVLVMRNISESKKNISMLVTKQSATFTKKGKGIVRFTCADGTKINKAISAAIKTGEGQTISLHAIGLDETDEVVSTFEFEWSLKTK